LSVFANQRGIPSSHHGPLLEQLISKSKSSFYQNDTTFDSEFKRVHDNLMEHFSTKLEYWVNAFLDSPAGVLFTSEFDNARYEPSFWNKSDSFRKAKVQLSTVPLLASTDLRYYKDLEGIKFTIAEVFDFWEPILLLNDVYYEVLS